MGPFRQPLAAAENGAAMEAVQRGLDALIEGETSEETEGERVGERVRLGEW